MSATDLRAVLSARRSYHPIDSKLPPSTHPHLHPRTPRPPPRVKSPVRFSFTHITITYLIHSRLSEAATGQCLASLAKLSLASFINPALSVQSPPLRWRGSGPTWLAGCGVHTPLEKQSREDPAASAKFSFIISSGGPYVRIGSDMEDVGSALHSRGLAVAMRSWEAHPAFLFHTHTYLFHAARLCASCFVFCRFFWCLFVFPLFSLSALHALFRRSNSITT